MSIVKWTLKQFKAEGLYEEKAGSKECSFDGGKVVRHPNISDRIKGLLATPGGSTYKGDRSAQDSAVISALLGAGLSPADTYATFSASPRGRDAEHRKNGHFVDYVQRTIESGVGFINHNGHKNGHKSGHVLVDFAEPKSDSSGRNINVNFSTPKTKSTGVGLISQKGSDVEVGDIDWLWPGYIPSGNLTLLAGDPGMAKSTIAIDIAATLSKGGLLPTGDHRVTGNSLIISAEDSSSNTITPRLIACKAKIGRIHIMDGEIIDPDGSRRYLSFSSDGDDLELLEAKIIATKARFVVIDPFNAFLEKGVDSHKDQSIRTVLRPLKDLAESMQVSILIILHLNKKGDSNPLYRVGGSIAFTGAARSVLGVESLDDEYRVLHSIKANLSVNSSALKYQVKQVSRTKTSEYTWKGNNVVNSSAIRWCGLTDFNPKKITTPEEKDTVSDIDDAVRFLQLVLTESEPLGYTEVCNEAKRAGFKSMSLIRQAGSVLKVRKDRINDHGNLRWIWRIPES